jgi:hypothetical protein
VFNLVIIPIGWFGPGFKPWLTFSLSLVVFTAAFLLSKRRTTLVPLILMVLGLSVVAFTANFASILLFDAYNPLNDTFTYLVHGQYLQQFAFSTPGVATGLHPALAQVTFYQRMHARMGSSFLLGWVQSMFGLHWSYLAYPAVVCLPLIALSLSMAGAVRFILRGAIWGPFLVGVALPLSLNGYSFGVVTGFLPQSFGIAYAFGGVALLGTLSFSHWQRATLGQVSVHLIPIAVLFGAQTFAYPEFTPLAALGVILWCVAVIALDTRSARTVALYALVLLCAVVIILNAELLRIAAWLRTQASAMVGGPIEWHSVDFLLHATGFRSSQWDFDVPLFGTRAASTLVGLLTIGCGFLFCLLPIVLKRAKAVLPFLTVCFSCAAAFLYFRYLVSSPWEAGVGQSWSQLKLTNWVAPFAITIVGCGWCALATGTRLQSLLAASCAVLILGAGASSQPRLARLRSDSIKTGTGKAHSPFAVYEAVRDSLARLAPDEIIYLDLPEPLYKHRQMLTYFLSDRSLASDWSGDGYLFPWLPSTERTIPRSTAKWLLVHSSAFATSAGGQRWGNFILKPMPSRRVALLSVSGGYGGESDASGWWHWAKGHLEFRLRVEGKLPALMRLRWTQLPAAHARTSVVLVSGLAKPLAQVLMRAGWSQFVSEPFEVSTPEVSVRITDSDPPLQISASDPRLVSFLVKNLELEPVE